MFLHLIRHWDEDSDVPIKKQYFRFEHSAIGSAIRSKIDAYEVTLSRERVNIFEWLKGKPHD